MKNNYSKAAVILGCLLVSSVAQANPNISSLDTGAGLYSANTGASLADLNWTVSLLSTFPSGQIPPGGIPTGAAYLVPNNIGFPFGYWAPNSPTSSWITYSYPTQVGGDNTDDTFQYQLQFTAANSGVIGINFLSDNTDQLYVNGNNIGSNPGQFGSWLATPLDYTVTAGTAYTVDLDVNNTPQGYGNPTGANVEFTGDVSVGGPPVPSPSIPDAASTLTLLGIGVGGLAGLRRQLRRA